MSSTTSTPDVPDVLLQLTDTLGPDFDLAGLLYDLAVACVQLLEIDAAGVMLLDENAHLIPIAATHNSAGALEQLQTRTGLGPCMESARAGRAVSCADLAQEGQRWPDFTRVARGEGFGAVYAVPLTLHRETVGGVNLFRRSTGVLTEVDRRTVVRLTTAATIGLLHRRTVHELDTINGQLQRALDSRVVIEQAKGFLVARYGLTLEIAFTLLRGYARPRRQRLTQVAQGVLDGAIDVT